MVFLHLTASIYHQAQCCYLIGGDVCTQGIIDITGERQLIVPSSVAVYRFARMPIWTNSERSAAHGWSRLIGQHPQNELQVLVDSMGLEY